MSADLHILPVDGKRPVAALGVRVAVDDVEVGHQGCPGVAVLAQRRPRVDPVTNLGSIVIGRDRRYCALIGWIVLY